MAKRNKLIEIVLSRFKREKEETLLKREICKGCTFNTKNIEIVSFKQQCITLLSKFLTLITLRKDEDLGACSICTCDVYWKSLSNDECPKGYWPKTEENGNN